MNKEAYGFCRKKVKRKEGLVHVSVPAAHSNTSHPYKWNLGKPKSAEIPATQGTTSLFLYMLTNV